MTDQDKIEAVKKRMAFLRGKIAEGSEDKEQLHMLLGLALKEGLFLGLRKHDLYPEFYPRDVPTKKEDAP